MVLLAACEAPYEPGVMAPVEGFAGVVAGDEPRAVTIGRDIIGNGGSAADAAVAMYFAMMVTLPSRVGVAGSGACVVHNSGLGAKAGAPFAEAFEFLPDPAAPAQLQLAGPRAMAVMHARHGVLRWEALLIEAERLARLGHGASRAFATDLASAADFVAASPELREIFSGSSGRLAREGDQVVQLELSGLISGLRRQGAGYLYTGAFANRFVEAANRIGLAITSQSLREAGPAISPPLAVPAGDNVAYFTPHGGGLPAAQLFGALTRAENYPGASPAGRAHLLAEAGQRVFAARGAWLGDGGDRSALVGDAHFERLMQGVNLSRHAPAAEATAVPAVSNPFTAGFVAADRWSSAVACSFSLGGLFGDGRVVPGTGITVPKAPQPGADNLSSTIIANTNNGNVYFAGTASGGLAAPAALARVMLESRGGGELAAAVAAPRVVNVGVPDITYVEPSLPDDIQSALRQYGHEIRTESVVGRANALSCPRGLRFQPGECDVATDPRGYGLGVIVQ